MWLPAGPSVLQSLLGHQAGAGSMQSATSTQQDSSTLAAASGIVLSASATQLHSTATGSQPCPGSNFFGQVMVVGVVFGIGMTVKFIVRRFNS